ncbi:MAG: fimbria major subunit [Bacteroidales bacterium]|nr:fimbria major subunit [Bacteroidales bacterium]
MKKIYGFAALCAAMTLASCSNNDEPIVPVDGSTTATVAGYLSVNIANSSNGTRADFQYGSPEESRAKTATFVFFDADGDYVTMSPNQELTSTNAPGSSAPNVERDYNVMVPVGVLVDDDIDNKAEAAATIAATIDRVVVILNPTATINTAVTNQSESKVLEIAADYSALTADNEFVMTNSVYMDGDNNFVYGQDVNGKIYSSQLEATQNAVDLYVERVVARVDVKAAEDGFKITAPEISIYDYDTNHKMVETKNTYNMVVTGIEVANIANQSYLVKNLDESFKTAGRFDGWNDAANFRSHWATAWSFNTTLDADRTLAEANQKDITKTYFRNQSYNTFNNGSYPSNGSYSASFYVNENTNATNKTALVVSCEIQDADGKGVTFYRTEKDGRYYSEEGVTNVLLDMLKREGYYVATAFNEENKPTALRNLEASDLDFVSAVKAGVDNATGYQGYLAFKDAENAGKMYQTRDGGVSFEKVDNFVSNVLHSQAYTVWKWNEGKCYFYVELNNGEDEADGEGKIAGIIRNHIYEVSLTSMMGFGIPVFDPTDVIVPETPDKLTPEDEWSLACNIHILSWVRYQQEGNFSTDY